VDLVRLDGRLYRVVGRTVIEGREHKVLAPVGRGPMRAVPVDVPRETLEGVTEAGESDNGCHMQRVVSSAQGARSSPPARTTARRTLSPAARCYAALWPQPGRIGCGPIFTLLAVLGALTIAFG